MSTLENECKSLTLIKYTGSTDSTNADAKRGKLIIWLRRNSMCLMQGNLRLPVD